MATRDNGTRTAVASSSKQAVASASLLVARACCCSCHNTANIKSLNFTDCQLHRFVFITILVHSQGHTESVQNLSKPAIGTAARYPSDTGTSDNKRHAPGTFKVSAMMGICCGVRLHRKTKTQNLGQLNLETKGKEIFLEVILTPIPK